MSWYFGNSMFVFQRGKKSSDFHRAKNLVENFEAYFIAFLVSFLCTFPFEILLFYEIGNVRTLTVSMGKLRLDPNTKMRGFPWYNCLQHALFCRPLWRLFLSTEGVHIVKNFFSCFSSQTLKSDLFLYRVPTKKITTTGVYCSPGIESLNMSAVLQNKYKFPEKSTAWLK